MPTRVNTPLLSATPSPPPRDEEKLVQLVVMIDGYENAPIELKMTMLGVNRRQH